MKMTCRAAHLALDQPFPDSLVPVFGVSLCCKGFKWQLFGVATSMHVMPECSIC